MTDNLNLSKEILAEYFGDNEQDFKKRNQVGEVWRRMRKNKTAMLGLAVIIIFALLAIFADFSSISCSCNRKTLTWRSTRNKCYCSNKFLELQTCGFILKNIFDCMWFLCKPIRPIAKMPVQRIFINEIFLKCHKCHWVLFYCKNTFPIRQAKT